MAMNNLQCQHLDPPNGFCSQMASAHCSHCHKAVCRSHGQIVGTQILCWECQPRSQSQPPDRDTYDNSQSRSGYSYTNYYDERDRQSFNQPTSSADKAEKFEADFEGS